jgi:hypothetical protein
MSIGLVDLKDLQSGMNILRDGPHCSVVGERGLAMLVVEVLQGDRAAVLEAQRTVVGRDGEDDSESRAHFASLNQSCCRHLEGMPA